MQAARSRERRPPSARTECRAPCGPTPAAHSSGLRGADLVEQIAHNTKLQKQRWADIYRRLWERKAKVDIADAILIVDGTPRDWFFTSPTTGEVQRRPDSLLAPIAIKKHFVRQSDPSAVSRDMALLLVEDADGDMAYALLDDLDFNLVLGQASSALWTASFLLQPFLAKSRQHPQYPGTLVGKFNAATTSSVRVLQVQSCFYDLKRYIAPVVVPTSTSHSHPCSLYSSTSTATAGTASTSARPRSAPATSTSTDVHTRARSHIHSASPRGPAPAPLPRSVEELIRTETAKLVHEVETAARDKLRQLTAEFKVTRDHRLVLVRVGRVVYASDLLRQPRAGRAKVVVRAASTGGTSANRRCAGGHFCHCKAFATGEINKTSTALSTSKELQQMTRKSLHMCDDESRFLEGFGAHAEAHLETIPTRVVATSQDAYEAFKRVLQRRMFMLRSTLWNPDSDSFNAKPLAWEDEKKKQPQQYEMVRVCRTCYLIYHAMDAERFQATKSTVKAAARRLTMLHNAKLMSAPKHPTSSRQVWDVEEDEMDLNPAPPRNPRRTVTWTDIDD